MRGGRILADGPAATGALNQNGVVANDAGTVVEIRGVDFQLDAISAGIGNFIAIAAGDDTLSGPVGATIIVDDGTRLHGNLVGNFFAFGTATIGTIRIGRVDYDAVNIALRFFGNGYLSRTRQLTATGSTPVPIVWPDINSSDRIFFRLVTPGGTPTPYDPPYAITEGVGFSVTFAAGDTSVYEYIIDPV